jgi:hypothetical protein
MIGMLFGQSVPLPVYEGAAQGPWFVMESGPILVYYKAGQEATAREVILYARDVYEELTYLFDYQMEGQIALRLHPNMYSYGQTPRWRITSALAAPPNLAEIVRLADKPAFVGQVRAEVTALFLMQFYYGGGTRFQNRILLYMPDWFLWGFAFLWGEGWTTADRIRLSIEHPYHLRRLWQREAAPSPTYRSLYKAIWHWLYRNYGQKKLIDLLYMVRLTRNVSEALNLTLNISEEELTEKWMNFLEDLRKGVPSSETAWLDIPALEGKSIIEAAVSRKGEIAAVLWDNQTSRIEYWHILPTGERVRLPGSFRWVGGGGYYGFYEIGCLPLGYSAAGQLAWVSYRPTGTVLWVWNPQKEEGASAYSLTLKGISSLAWRDEETLLLVGWEDGDAQVYEFDVRRDRLRALTQKPGDKKEVFWTGRELYYLWQADSMGHSGYGDVWRNYGWAEGPGRWVHRELVQDWGGGWLQRGETLVSAQNLEGRWRAWIVMSDTMYPSAWSAPGFIRWIGAGPERAYYLSYRSGGKKVIGSVSWDTLLEGGTSYPDVYAAEAIQMRLQKFSRYPQTQARISPPPVEKADTALQDTPRKSRGAFYYFDEELERPRRKARRQMSPPIPRGKYFYPDSVRIQNGGQVVSQGLWQGIRVIPVLHPLIRLGLHIQTGVETFSGRYYVWGAWRPYVDLRSSELWLGFQKRTGWWRPYFQGHWQMHYFSERRYGQGLRLLSWASEGGVKVLMGPRGEWEFSGAGLFLYSRRYDLTLRDQVTYDAEGVYWGGRLGIAYQKFSYREAFLWRGRRLALRGELYRRGTLSHFGLLHAEGAWHQPILSWLVADVVGQAALGSPTNPRFFLLGGIPNWINYEVQNRSQLPLLGPVGGYYLNTFISLPGYPYHVRRGRNLLLAGIAMRIPLLALNPPPVLPTRPIYNLEWKVGFYAATTWSTGNPFSQKNPIDAEYIYKPPLVITVQTLRSPFLMSMGTGIKFRVMGLPLEASLYWPIEEARVGKVQFLLSFHAPLP